MSYVDNKLKLRDMLDRDKCVHCENNDSALVLFEELRDKLFSINVEAAPSKPLSGRQISVAKSAIQAVRDMNYVRAVNYTYDFVQNFQSNEHTVTDAEYTVLSMIVTAVLG